MKKSFFIIALSGAAAAVLLIIMVKTALRAQLEQQKRVTVQTEERPEICARNGALLIGNRKRTKNTQRKLRQVRKEIRVLKQFHEQEIVQGRRG